MSLCLISSSVLLQPHLIVLADIHLRGILHLAARNVLDQHLLLLLLLRLAGHHWVHLLQQAILELNVLSLLLLIRLMFQLMVHQWLRLGCGCRGWRKLGLLLLDVRRSVQQVSLPHLLSLLFVRQMCPRSPLYGHVLGVHQVCLTDLLRGS